MEKETEDVEIPAEQIDKPYYYPSGDEITDVRRKIGVHLKWHYFGGLFGMMLDVFGGDKRDSHDMLVDYRFDSNNRLYIATVFKK